jgi:hypothetical protein
MDYQSSFLATLKASIEATDVTALGGARISGTW